MASRSRGLAVLVVLVLSALTFAPQTAAVGEAQCHAADEWELPARIDVGDWCGAIDRDHAFWGRAGEYINLFARATSGQDLRLCLVNPFGVTVICHDSGGYGNAETITQFVASATGWWTARVFPEGPAYTLRVDLSSYHAEDDCGNVGDGAESFSTAQVATLPNFFACQGELPATDLADFFKVEFTETGGRLRMNATVASRLCIFKPGGYGDGTCADIAPDGWVFENITQTGMWRFAIMHRPGIVAGDYEIGAIYAAPNHAPTMARHVCSPQGAHAGSTVTCEIRANEPDGDSMYYIVDWGDATGSERVPTSGYATQAFARLATHVFPGEGNFTVRVTAFDNRTPALSSGPATASVEVVHARPVMGPVSCAPSAPRPGDEVTCTFVANDDSAGVAYTYDWGDGTPSARVPEVGFTSPGIAQSVSRTFNLKGTYVFQANATDNGAPPAATASVTSTIVVSALAPTGPFIDCGSDRGSAGQPLACSFRSSDPDSQNVFYTVDWGDGSIERLPPTGYATPGVAYPTGHTYPTSGYRSIVARATDDSPVPQSGPTVNRPVTIGTLQVVSGSNIAGTSLDVNQGLAPGEPVIDGTWVALAAPGRGDASTPIRLTVLSGTVGADLDVHFYNAARSSRMDDGACARTGSAPEACNAPSGAEWAFVRSAALSMRNNWQLAYLY